MYNISIIMTTLINSTFLYFSNNFYLKLFKMEDSYLFNNSILFQNFESE